MLFSIRGFLLIKIIEAITKLIDISKAIVGSSLNMKKAKIVAKIGLQKARDIPFETSILLIPSKRRKVPKPEGTIPKKEIQNHAFKL